MNHNPTSEEISRRAYDIWEKRGRPDDQPSSIECWLQAERELRAGRGERDEDASGGRRRRQTSVDASRDGGGDNAPDPAAAFAENDVRITNLDTALPIDERRRVREARHPERAQPPERQQVDTFLVLIDRAHLRIFRAARGAPEEVESIDLPAGRRSYTDNDTDQAGRFSGPRAKGARAGTASIDERLPMQEETQRRLARDAAGLLENFLREHPHARWHFSAGPALHQAVLDALSPGAHARLDTAIKKDLVNTPRAELASHFQLNGA